MRVLQLHCSYRLPGGEDMVVAREAELLRSAGHDVVQHLEVNPGSSWKALERGLLSAWNPGRERAIRSLIQRSRPDVVHVHNTWFGLSSSVFRAARDVPTVATLHNYRTSCANGQLIRNGAPCERCVGTNPLPGVLHRCSRGSLGVSAASALAIEVRRRAAVFSHYVDLLLCPSEFSRRIHERAGLPAHKLVVKPNFAQDPGARLAPPSASRDVLFVGRLSPEKGLDTLVSAWDRARPVGLRLVVIGEGPISERIRATSTPGVVVLDRKDPSVVRDKMLRARALVFPSTWYEVQPLVLLEALAAGLPVLGSRLGAIAETLGPLGPDWLVRSGDVRAWGDHLQMLNQDALVDHAGAAARQIYEACYREDSALASLELLYGRATGVTPPPSGARPPGVSGLTKRATNTPGRSGLPGS